MFLLSVGVGSFARESSIEPGGRGTLSAAWPSPLLKHRLSLDTSVTVVPPLQRALLVGDKKLGLILLLILVGLLCGKWCLDRRLGRGAG